MKVLNFGSLNLDYVYRVKEFVQPGETLAVLSQEVLAGGKGLNQSVALARAGAEVYHAGLYGKGGELLKQTLTDSGVHTEYLLSSEELQGNAVIQVNDKGENCILLYGGSNQCITEQQIEETLSHFSAGDYLVLQNEINHLPLIVDKAYAIGMKIVLNPSPFNEKLNDVDFGKLSWIFVNEIEAKQLSGFDDADAAYAAIHRRYPDLSVLITLGKAGSVAYTNGERCVQPIFDVKVVDTTAAGDTFTGYFIASVMQQLPLSDAMKRATAASSIGVSRKGASPSIPTSQEVTEFLNNR